MKVGPWEVTHTPPTLVTVAGQAGDVDVLPCTRLRRGCVRRQRWPQSILRPVQEPLEVESGPYCEHLCGMWRKVPGNRG